MPTLSLMPILNTQLYANEIQSMNCVIVQPTIYEIDEIKHPLRYLPNGSILTIIGKSQSKTLSAICQAVELRSITNIEQIVKRHRRRLLLFKHRNNTSDSIFAELHYAGKPIITDIALKLSSDISIIISPFNGGKLAHNLLSLISYSRDNYSDIKGIIIIIHPVLTYLEKQIQDMVPEPPSKMSNKILKVASGWACGKWLLPREKGQTILLHNTSSIRSNNSLLKSFGINSTAEDYLQERINCLINSTLVERRDGFDEPVDE